MQGWPSSKTTPKGRNRSRSLLNSNYRAAKAKKLIPEIHLEGGEYVFC